MTLVVATITAKTPEAMVQRAQRARADVIELRLDTLDQPQVVDAATPAPVLATIRRQRDGGLWQGNEEARQRMLIEAAALARLVDVELDVAQRMLPKLDTPAVVSHHDLHETPEPAAIVSLVETAYSVGAAVAKVATRVHGPQDVLALLEAAHRIRDLGIPYAVMGLGDSTLRAAAGRLGMALVYAATGEPAAPGQLPQLVQSRLAGRGQTGATRITALLGHPVRHSLSPAMWNAAYDAAGMDHTYVALEVQPGHVGAAVRVLEEAGAAGCNVTTPHKHEALKHATPTPEATAAGSANTIRFTDRGPEATNTDGAAIANLLQRHAPTARHVVIAGSGAVARAAHAALTSRGVPATVVARNPARAPWAPAARPLDDLATLAPDAVVNCTPVLLPVPAGPVVIDVAYPLPTRGPGHARGEDVLHEQALLGFRFIHGTEPPAGIMRAALWTAALERDLGVRP